MFSIHSYWQVNCAIQSKMISRWRVCTTHIFNFPLIYEGVASTNTLHIHWNSFEKETFPEKLLNFNVIVECLRRTVIVRKSSRNRKERAVGWKLICMVFEFTIGVFAHFQPNNSDNRFALECDSGNSILMLLIHVNGGFVRICNAKIVCISIQGQHSDCTVIPCHYPVMFVLQNAFRLQYLAGFGCGLDYIVCVIRTLCASRHCTLHVDACVVCGSKLNEA